MVITALMTLLIGLVGPAHAGVLPPDYSLIARTSDGFSKGVCEFTVTSVNYDTGVVKAGMRAEVRPTRVRAYFSNAHVHEVCALMDPGGTVLARLVADENGPKASDRKSVAVPQRSGYILCSWVQTTLKSGAQKTSPTSCAG